MLSTCLHNTTEACEYCCCAASPGHKRMTPQHLVKLQHQCCWPVSSAVPSAGDTERANNHMGWGTEKNSRVDNLSLSLLLGLTLSRSMSPVHERSWSSGVCWYISLNLWPDPWSLMTWHHHWNLLFVCLWLLYCIYTLYVCVNNTNYVQNWKCGAGVQPMAWKHGAGVQLNPLKCGVKIQTSTITFKLR